MKLIQNIQDKQFELLAALSISVNEISFTISNNLQNTNNILSSDCKTQLIAL